MELFLETYHPHLNPANRVVIGLVIVMATGVQVMEVQVFGLLAGYKEMEGMVAMVHMGLVAEEVSMDILLVVVAVAML